MFGVFWQIILLLMSYNCNITMILANKQGSVDKKQHFYIFYFVECQPKTNMSYVPLTSRYACANGGIRAYNVLSIPRIMYCRIYQYSHRDRSGRSIKRRIDRPVTRWADHKTPPSPPPPWALRRLPLPLPLVLCCRFILPRQNLHPTPLCRGQHRTINIFVAFCR